MGTPFNSRDIPWGIPMPEVDPDIVGKTLYVWPDSLIAPIAFTEVALEAQGRDPKSTRISVIRMPRSISSWAKITSSFTPAGVDVGGVAASVGSPTHRR